MKKRLILFLCLFLFITNVKALTFNVDITNIEYSGNNGTAGSVSDIDIENKTLNALFKNIGDEVSFNVIITNSGDRAGTLKSIGITSTNDKISYTTNLPERGLSINGNDTNSVTITAKVLEGATNGTSSSTIKLTYNYDEGSCPEGETLSEDETKCLCPEGYERNQEGKCVKPETKVTCEDDEIYNETKKICEKKITCKSDEVFNETKKICEKKITCKEDEKYNETTKLCEKIIKCKSDEVYNANKKICEKKETPVVEEEPVVEKVIPIANPKTLDNIILIVLLFIVSGLGIYAVLFRKLKTKKNKTVAGLIIGVLTLGTSLTVLVGVFGFDKLLGAIINPVTKSTELTLTVNEEIDMMEVWDGTCPVSSLTPENIFEGGSGTEEDPYQIKTASQLACFAKSVTNGTTYEGKFVSQTRDIVLNENLNGNMEAGTTDGLHLWSSAGNSSSSRYFAGTYNGNSHVISGLYITNSSASGKRGMFSYTSKATLKNMVLSDVYMDANSEGNGVLIGSAINTLNLDNITVSGKNETYRQNSGGIVGSFYGSSSGAGWIRITNTTNNIGNVDGGVVSRISGVGASDEPNIYFLNVVNNGDFRYLGGVVGGISGASANDQRPNLLFDNVVNNGNRSGGNNGGASYGGLCGPIAASKVVMQNSGNTGNIQGNTGAGAAGGLAGSVSSLSSITIENCYNSGNITFGFNESYLDGLTDAEINTIRNTNPTGLMGGLIGSGVTPADNMITIKDSYNSGTLSLLGSVGGLIGFSKNRDDKLDGNLTIDNCYNIGAIRSGDGSIAGLVAATKGTIKDSYNKGDITIYGYRNAYNQLSGGSYNSGNTSGGLVGKNNNLTWDSTFTGANIIDSYNEGNVLITAKTGTVNFGGICGICNSISGSHNSGTITSKYASQYIDGISYRVFNTPTDTYFDGEIVTENLSY